MATRNTHVGKDRLSKSNSSTNADRVTDKKKTHLRTQVSGVRDRARLCRGMETLTRARWCCCLRACARLCVCVCLCPLARAFSLMTTQIAISVFALAPTDE